ncbi:MAG TPA: ankyrin repeat domain-containing protein [Streptosporangiaceae bacterium]|jgi:ankyrin repeat protein
MDSQDPEAMAMVQAIHAGDTTALDRLLSQHPGLASEQVHGTRTPLHVVADWPGYFPAGPATVRLLISAGADSNAVVTQGTQAETPLHWAASSDDADVAEALISGGADLDRPGGSIGTPLENAVGCGCWNVAHLLVQHGAPVGKLWLAAALGLMPQVEELLAVAPAPSPDDLTEAFWQACHGGQRRSAERLLASGADPDGRPGYSDQSSAEVAAEPGTQRDNLIAWLHDRQQNPQN